MHMGFPRAGRGARPDDLHGLARSPPRTAGLAGPTEAGVEKARPFSVSQIVPQNLLKGVPVSPSLSSPAGRSWPAASAPAQAPAIRRRVTSDDERWTAAPSSRAWARPAHT
eukprot:scaffold115_cov304-Prasinococcus_capsulatus_cf.AAC.51